MTLRVRLTLFYTLILGGVLVLLGMAIFSQVSNIITNQVDRNLAQVALDMRQLARIDHQGRFYMATELSVNSSIAIQVWDTGGRLVASTQSFNPLSSLVFPLYPEGLTEQESFLIDTVISDEHMRVYSVPMEMDSGEDPVGTIQVATSLAAVDDVQNDLLNFLFGLGILALIIAVAAGWFSTRRILAPLATMTETAMQITRADDLSRRIPEHGNPADEVGRLVQAFNQTMGRMEDLFNSQRRFIADVGHELRTPLTVMKGNVDLLRRISNRDDDSLKSIESEVDRLTRLVGDLLLLAYAESGKLPLDNSLIELDTLLLEVFQQARILAHEEMGVAINDIDQVLVCGDYDRLKQVLLNLVANAINYTPAGGKVEMSLRKSEKMAYLMVTDNGPGISSEDLVHIFERFYRGEKSRARSPDGKGFGLGLPIANWIVINHGGRIEVESVVGKGTTFCVRLPLAQGGCEPEAGIKIDAQKEFER
ncbi:MAG: HAMP domain-containing protein [Chloroflexi bacterium]|nr:HAMP domain-containing protein [Chloroflexota bacterium]